MPVQRSVHSVEVVDLQRSVHPHEPGAVQPTNGGWRCRLLWGLFCSIVLGCEQNHQGALCQDSFNTAQQTVNQIDAAAIDSVEKSLKAVDAALLACKKEGKSGEVEELTAARHKIAAHYEWLKSRPPKQQRRTPEELERLAKEGDPNCPKGMAYKQRETGKEVRCVGPVPVNMPFDKARAYYEGRDFRVRPGKSSNIIEMEYGAELHRFEYSSEHSKEPPRCVTVYPPPGMGWQEAAARLTGARVDRIKAGEPVKAGARKLMLRVVDEPNKVLVRLGEC